ncbi:MAG TPA: DUF1285 domain-containing protein [Desulfomonilia bacterium]
MTGNCKLRDVSATTRIRIDREGRWFYEDSEIIHPMVLKVFCDALEIDDQGRYRIIVENELCHIDVEDAPFIVRTIRGDCEHGLELLLNNHRTAPLDPGTLFFGRDNILYARLADGIVVKFSRAAYYQLALMMEENENGGICLKVKEKSYLF